MSPDAPLPSGEEALGLPLDQLALRILKHGAARDGLGLTRGYVTYYGTWRFVGNITPTSIKEVLAKVTEAWDLLLWLRLFELDFVSPNVLPEQAAVTERGRDVANRDEDLAFARAASRIDLGLHSLLTEDDVPGAFARRDFDTAVFRSMRRVEITVRGLAQLDEGDVGWKLMRKAFDPETGPLTDYPRDAGERKSTADLFSGALGTFKNPSSHREVDFADPVEVAEIVLFADLLLRRLDKAARRHP